MDYHLENKILLSEKSEHKGLYSWSLQEFDKDDKKVEGDQIPWLWSLYFTASELRHSYSIEISDESYDENTDSTEDRELISAILHSGIYRDGECLQAEVSYSMFGTNRTINEFELRIHKIEEKNVSKKKCHIWGCVSYTSELDFRYKTTNDTVIIYLDLSPEKFNVIVELIKAKRVDILEVRLKGVSGFYSEWSPSISTNEIKVLADADCQKIIMQDGCKIDPPRLGEINEFDMTVIQIHKPNTK